jgi:hypothetical protein
MATATNNVHGPTGMPTGQDHRDGAGGINAKLADTVASLHRTDSTPCNAPCWWNDVISAGTFDASGYRNYYFTGKAGDRIRVAIAWDSSANCFSIGEGCGADQLLTNLNLGVWAPNGALLSGGWSAGWDKSYELVPSDQYLVLPQDGTYRIGVYKQSFGEAQNFLGVAWTIVPPISPVVDSRGSGLLDLYVRGGDDAIWMNSRNSSGIWTGWQVVGGVATSEPAAVSWDSNRIDVFMRGSDNYIYQKTWTPGAWTNWTNVSGTAASLSAPAVASWGPGRLDLFMRGIDNMIYWKAYTGGSWGGWASLGGPSNSAPAAISRGTNAVDLYMRGTDNQIYYKFYNGSSWSASWTSLGGVATSAPTVSSWGANRLDVFVRNTLSGVSQRTWTSPGGWTGWINLGGTIVGNPGAASWGSNHIGLWVQSDVSDLQFQNTYTTAWSGWQQIGEVP